MKNNITNISAKKKLGLFGGSFNPPHNGHLHLAREFRDKLSLDKIVIMPANIPPHKSSGAFAEAAERIQMCRLAFEESFFEVSTMEINRGGTSYTVDTVRELAEIYPDYTLHLLVGTDMLYYFDKWKDYNKILEQAVLCVIMRHENDELLKMRAYCREVLRDYDDKIQILNTAPYEINSTKIRENVKSGESIAEFLPEKVCDYIKQRGLYIDN